MLRNKDLFYFFKHTAVPVALMIQFNSKLPALLVICHLVLITLFK